MAAIVGEDEARIGDKPLRHGHPNTKAEALTTALARNFAGGSIMGDFVIGSKFLMSQGSGYGPGKGGRVQPLECDQDGTLTYPLWGQNILDWRTPKQTHNNVPPSLNVFVRYLDETDDAWVVGDSEETVLSFRGLARRGVADGDPSAADAQYESKMVCELEQYTDEHLTPSDSTLRVSLDDSTGGVDIKRQTIQNLLDIFASNTNDNLSMDDLRKHLDNLLQSTSGFMKWVSEKNAQLDVVRAKIDEAKRLMVSVPTLNYVGRIVISTKDDTEQKVIANYGGKRWRRIENFLRGVDPNNEANLETNLPGRKLGEEYVALRESNIPIHTHSETISGT